MATGLLVLDMLTDFTSGKLANPAAAQIIEPIAAEPVKLIETSGCWIYPGIFLGLDGRAWLVDPYLGG